MLSEVAGGSHSCFALLFEVILILFDAVHDNPLWVNVEITLVWGSAICRLPSQKASSRRATRRCGWAALELRGKGRRSQRKAFTPVLPYSIDLAAACGG